MKAFRYLIAKYRTQDESKPLVNIGIIIQDNDEIKCKFNPSLEQVASVVGENIVDDIIFKNLEKTFNKNFSEKQLTITDKITGQRKTIQYTSPEYLTYLLTNFLNNYVFENYRLIEAENIEEGLLRLYKNFVDPNFIKTEKRL